MFILQKRTIKYHAMHCFWLVESRMWIYMMILALYQLYSDTKMILGEAVIKATVGVKQGSLTSCFYTLYRT